MKLLHKNGPSFPLITRESCSVFRNTYVKDMSRLGRELKNVILVDVNDQYYNEIYPIIELRKFLLVPT